MNPGCMHKGCSSDHTKAQFTKALGQMVEKEKQPEWYCVKHAPHHPNVSPTGGRYGREVRVTQA